MTARQFILDTQVFLWMGTSPSRLSEKARDLLRGPENILYISAVTSWEIAIKYALRKLPLPVAPAAYVPERIVRDRLTPLLIHHSHALRVAELPKHHADPFDRLLIAQAQLEKVPLLTADRQLEVYDVELSWAD